MVYNDFKETIRVASSSVGQNVLREQTYVTGQLKDEGKLSRLD